MTYATGGSVSQQGNRRVHVFTTSGTLTVTIAGDADVLVVAGGGGGGQGTSTPSAAGGGGGGGVLEDTISLTATAHTVTVGDGGAGATSNLTNGGDGTNSSIGALAIAIGGGGGGGAVSPAAGSSGGSGGGGLGATVASTTLGGSGTVGQGNDGGDGYGHNTTSVRAGGGGGGAGAAGANGTSDNGGAGGAGAASSISGSSVTYGGGGGGAGTNPGSGGAGGGGAGGTVSGVNATANTGGGGGGARGGDGGDGGSGIVIVSYFFVADNATSAGASAEIIDRRRFTSPSAVIEPIHASTINVAPFIEKMPMIITSIYEPLPGTTRIDRVPINPELDDVKITNNMPGGYGVLSVGVDPHDPPEGSVQRMIRPAYNKPFAHIVGRSGHDILHEGQMIDMTWGDGFPSGMSSLGYGQSAVNDEPYFSSGTALTPTGELLRTIIRETSPYLRIGDSTRYIDPGTEHRPVDFNGRSLAQIIEQISQEGCLGMTPVDFAVWEKRTVHLSPRCARTYAPSYALPMNGVAWQETYENVVTHVTVAYRNVLTDTDATTDTAVNERTQSWLGGRTRHILIDGGSLLPAAAEQYRDTYLFVNRLPRVTASINIPITQWITTPTGQQVPPWLVRSGRFIKFGDQRHIAILSVSIEPSVGVVGIEAGYLDSENLDVILGNLQRVSEFVASNSSPNTGARR